MNARTVCFIGAALLALALFKGNDWTAPATATTTSVSGVTDITAPASDAAVCTCPNCNCTFTEKTVGSTIYQTVGYGSSGTSGYQTVSYGSAGSSGYSNVSGGFVTGWRSYGGPARKWRAHRLARIESWGGPRSNFAGARLGNMNCRYCN